MNRNLNLFITLLLALTIGNVNLNAQTTAKEMATKMTRGINLGNTFDAADYEGAWAPATREKDFDAFKEAGITCVRIPITWGSNLSKEDTTLRLSDKKPFKVHPVFLERIDQVINWSLDRNMVTVINVHHDYWLKQTDAFDSQKDRFYALWKQIAKHYKDYDEKLLFEIVNEPHHESADGKDDGLTVEQVDEVNKTAFDIIRKTNPTRIVIYSGRGWGGLHELQKATPPAADDKYLMGTYHSYSPWSFAGEGKGTWGNTDDFKAMNDEFVNAKSYSEKHNIPVFIGEYGCDHKADYNSRMIHYATYLQNIQQYQVPATAWDDCGFRFKIYDRISTQWDDTKDIIVNYTTTSPNELKLMLLDGDFAKIDWTNRAENIEKTTIERRVGRKGNFTELAIAKGGNTYVDETSNEKQTYYYYRVVNHLKDGKKLISYPQRVYIP